MADDDRINRDVIARALQRRGAEVTLASDGAQVVASLRELGASVQTGRFGADMAVRLTNDGPFTILLET